MNFEFTTHAMDRLRSRFPGKMNDIELKIKIVELLNEPFYTKTLQDGSIIYQITNDNFCLFIKQQEGCLLVITGYRLTNEQLLNLE